MARDDSFDSRFKDLLQEFERSVREDADLEQLKVIRRQIRKMLPLSVRLYLPAYLLQEAVGAGVSRAITGSRRSDPKKEQRSRGLVAGKRAKGKKSIVPSAKPQVVQKAGAAVQPVDRAMKRLFVSVGRKRGVSRQGLTDLFMTKLGLKQEELGEVKVLDNYSFVELSETVTDLAIEKMNGETLNGRRLTVDYARNKKS